MRTTFAAILIALLAPAARPALAAPPARLTVNISASGAMDGSFRVALYDSQAAFDGGGAALRQVAVPASGPRSVVFEGLTPGRYAIRGYHDRNDNGRLDANGFGIPQEPYGFSNNARGVMGPAKWKDAAVNVPAGEAAQDLTLR